MPMLYCGKSKAGSSVKTLIKTLVFSARFPTTKNKNYMGAQPPSAATEKSLQAEKDFDKRIRGYSGSAFVSSPLTCNNIARLFRRMATSGDQVPRSSL